MIFRRKLNSGIVFTDVIKNGNPHAPRTQDEVFNDIIQMDIKLIDHTWSTITCGNEVNEIIESDDYITIIQTNEKIPNRIIYAVIPKSEIKSIEFHQAVYKNRVYGDIVKDEKPVKEIKASDGFTKIPEKQTMTAEVSEELVKEMTMVNLMEAMGWHVERHDDGRITITTRTKEVKPVENLTVKEVDKYGHPVGDHPPGWSPETTLKDEGVLPEP